MRVHGACINLLNSASPPQPSPPTSIHTLNISDHYKPDKPQDHASLKSALSCESMPLYPVSIQPLVGCVFVTGQ